MNEIKGGELLLRCLHQERVKYVHAITDGTYMAFLEPLERLGDEFGIRLVVPRHEAAAAHMCDSYTRVSGKPAVVMACAGPGAANLISGLICAEAEGSPVVAITTTRRSDIGDAYLQHAAMQIGDQQGYYKAAVKWSGKVEHWKRIPDMVRHAFRMAMSGRPGPVNLVIPQDILDQTGDFDSVELVEPERYRFSAMGKQTANEDAIRVAAELLTSATLVGIHVGNGCERAEAGEEVRALAEHLGMPITKTARGSAVVPCDHPQVIQTLSPGALLSHTQADVLLIVGTRLGEMSAFGQPPFWPDTKSAKTIQIDSEPTHIGVNRPVDVGLVGDAKAVLQQLLEAVKSRCEPRELHPAVPQFKALEAQWRQNLDEVADGMQEPMCVGAAVRECNRFFGDDVIVALDGGNTSWWGFHYLRARTERSFVHSTVYGHLGTGLPYALGAKLAHPDRPVYCISGDSAFGFNVQELETSIRENLPVTCIVMVDGAWGMEKAAQKRSFGREVPWFHMNLHEEVRYDRLCESLGGHGEYVTRASDLKPALERASASGKTTVIHCAIDPDSNIWPPGLEAWVALRSGKTTEFLMSMASKFQQT
jgi:acetolactate synthase-1/2/3 large subunit